jgi:hypothetical protein
VTSKTGRAVRIGLGASHGARRFVMMLAALLTIFAFAPARHGRFATGANAECITAKILHVNPKHYGASGLHNGVKGVGAAQFQFADQTVVLW